MPTYRFQVVETVIIEHIYDVHISGPDDESSLIKARAKVEVGPHSRVVEKECVEHIGTDSRASSVTHLLNQWNAR